jgi:hypothetical protein
MASQCLLFMNNPHAAVTHGAIAEKSKAYAVRFAYK